MREIIFRGKDERSIWEFGSLITDNKTYWLIDNFNDELTVNPQTVGQFTGFKTQNQSLVYDDSKEIFEDDVFRLKNSDTIYLVVFENGRWIGRSNEGDEWGKFTCEICNVRKDIILIGNIHDNPKLLEA